MKIILFYSVRNLVDLSEGTDVNKTSESRKCFVCNYVIIRFLYLDFSQEYVIVAMIQ